jgi:glyoxylase-like metal-dependent hydrolase (beta-lactamase superfamily II)
MVDLPLARAVSQIGAATCAPSPVTHGFFDGPTGTVSYVVHDPSTRRAVVIDSVLDFDFSAARTATKSADAIIAYVRELNLAVDWLLETHAHADHLSAASYLKDRLGGKSAIGAGIAGIGKTFGAMFNSGRECFDSARGFDVLFDDGDCFKIGSIAATVLHVPGHTPADLAYVIGDAVFTGDTLFMPDYGTARADFPGGDARQLYHSIRRLLMLPEATRLFHCHDYKTPDRDTQMWVSTVGAQRANNIHMRHDVSEQEFVAMRTARDASLPMPRLILPAIQINMRGGNLPAPEPNGIRYLTIPLNTL